MVTCGPIDISSLVNHVQSVKGQRLIVLFKTAEEGKQEYIRCRDQAKIQMLFKDKTSINSLSNLPGSPKIIFTCLSQYIFSQNCNIMEISFADFVYVSWKLHPLEILNSTYRSLIEILGINFFLSSNRLNPKTLR